MTTAVALLLSICASTAPLAAQRREPRFSAWAGAGAQAAMPSLDERFTFDVHAENATIEADYRTKATLHVDGGFAVRIHRNIGAGVSVSRFDGDSRAGIVAQIPYPFDFNRFREVTGTTSALDHSEIAYHVQLLYSRPLARRLRLVLSGGPTVFSARRQLVATIQVDETYPYDTATFRAATARIAKGTGLGFHAGADFVWMLGERAGVGLMTRYARGTADLKASSRTVPVDTGGLQSGFGLRLFF